jgi:hypothetical protein
VLVLVLVLVLVSSRLVTSPHNITRAAGTPKSVRQSTLTLPYIFHIFHIIASKRYQCPTGSDGTSPICKSGETTERPGGLEMDM